MTIPREKDFSLTQMLQQPATNNSSFTVWNQFLMLMWQPQPMLIRSIDVMARRAHQTEQIGCIQARNVILRTEAISEGAAKKKFFK